MRYFPMMYDSRGKKLLLVGAGEIAYQKLMALRQFEFNVTIIAQNFHDKTKNICLEMGYKIIERMFEISDINDFDVVIAATDDEKTQKEIFCASGKSLINSVDNPNFCNFIFPSFFEKSGILVAISSGAKAPSVSKSLKNRLKEAIPKNLHKLISKIDFIRQNEQAGLARMEKIKKLTKRWFKKNIITISSNKFL